MKQLAMIAPMVLLILALAVSAVSAGSDVTIDFDKTFDLSGARTWGWSHERVGQVQMAQGEDPESMRNRVEPAILSAITTEMSRGGRQIAVSKPALIVTYLLVLTPGAAVDGPEEVTRSSLVLNLSNGARVVWRGEVRADVTAEMDAERRQRVLRHAVRDLLRRLPRARD